LNRIAPTHVVCCTGRTHGGNIKTIEYLEGGADKTHENLRDNLYSVLFLADACRRLGIHYVYVGTGYIYRYDDLHPVGGRAFADTDVPNFFGNSYSVVKGFTDRLIALCNTDALNARITLPINFELHEERNLLAKLLTYPKIFDIPVSLTIMPDCMPILVDLMKRRVGGALNLVNPTPISLHDIVELYREIVDSDAGEHERIGIDSEIGARLMATKAHCALDTRRLVELCPTVPNARQSLETAFRQLASIKKDTD
jgi:dTDP-4-dehydrorhamnose reductase